MSNHIIKRGSSWYFKAVIGGRQILRSLGPITKDEAITAARKLFKAESADRMQMLGTIQKRSTYSALGKLFEEYCKAALLLGYPSKKTVKLNIWALSRMIFVVTGKRNVEDIHAGILDSALVRDYARAVLAQCEDEDTDSARRSIASMVAQARSIVSREMRQEYKGKLSLPDLTDFLDVSTGDVPRIVYRLPPLELRDKTKQAAEVLRKENPSLYAAYLLCYDLGLRAGEAQAAQWHWFEELPDGRRFIHVIKRPDERFKPKGKEGSVPVHATTWAELRAAAPGDVGKIIRHTDIDRLNDWMRSIGWDRSKYTKGVHELRKLIGSQWYKAFGAEGARERLRQANMQTTIDFYAAIDFQDLATLEPARAAG